MSFSGRKGKARDRRPHAVSEPQLYVLPRAPVTNRHRLGGGEGEVARENRNATSHDSGGQECEIKWAAVRLLPGVRGEKPRQAPLRAAGGCPRPSVSLGLWRHHPVQALLPSSQGLLFVCVSADSLLSSWGHQSLDLRLGPIQYNIILT